MNKKKFLTILLLSSLILFSHETNLQARSSASETKHDRNEQKIDTKTCDLLITFGSYGGGVDHETFKKVHTYFSKSPAVKSSESWSSGFEGDSTYCLQVDDGKSDKIYDEIRALVPTHSRKGWTSIEKKDGTRFQTEWPR